VVLCALAKEPVRRYPSAEQLALDLERHLAGHPVSARPATFLYRASRFLRRHALAAAVTAAFAVLLATLAISSAIQSSRVAAERDRAEPLLAEALALRRADGGDRAALATATDQLGVIHALQGDYEGAEPLLAEALALRERILEPGDPELATSLNNLALLRHDRGDYAGAAPLYRRAPRRRRSSPAPWDRWTGGWRPWNGCCGAARASPSRVRPEPIFRAGHHRSTVLYPREICTPTTPKVMATRT